MARDFLKPFRRRAEVLRINRDKLFSRTRTVTKTCANLSLHASRNHKSINSLLSKPHERVLALPSTSMLSPAARTSTIFLRTSFFPHRCWILRTAQPSFSHFRPLSTSRPPLISLEDLLKPTRQPKPNDAPTKNTTNGYGSPPTRASAQLFINRLPAGTARELEEKLREVFGSLGEVPAARVGEFTSHYMQPCVQYPIFPAQVSMQMEENMPTSDTNQTKPLWKSYEPRKGHPWQYPGSPSL